MKSFAKKAAGLSVVAALLVPAGALAAPPAHAKGGAPAKAKGAPPAHAKAYGKRCKGQSKVKDPVTKMSPFKACVKAKGVVAPPVVDPVVDPVVEPVVDPVA